MAQIALPKEVNKAVKTDIYNALRKGLVANEKNSKKTWSEVFVEKMLNEAKTNPSGPMGQLIARNIIREDILDKLDESTERMLARDIDFNEYRILKTLYREQQEVFNNRFNKKIIVIGSRRIGKSELAARLLVRDALRPNRHALYVNIKFENAIKQCWNNTLDLIHSLGIPTIEENKADGEIELYNGSTIMFKGNNDRAAADRLLGFKYSLAIIDEVQTQCNLQYLLDTVIGPTTADYPDSQIICLGTPPRVPHTYCEHIWRDLDGWSKYSWDMLKNPFLQNIAKLIVDLCKEKGCNQNAPFIQREYFGKWVYDDEARVVKNPLLYEASDSVEYIKHLIENGKFNIDYVYGGVDFGFSDYNAIITIAWDKKRGMGYIIDSFKFNRATVTEIVEKAKISLDRAQSLLIVSKTDPHNILYFGDNSDRSIIQELRNNYDFPIQCAYKHNKMEALSVLAELLRRKIYTQKDSPLFDEYEMTVYKRDEATDAILPELDDDSYHADALMAALYASRTLVTNENPLGKEDKADVDAAKLPIYKKPDDEVDFTDDLVLTPDDFTLY